MINQNVSAHEKYPDPYHGMYARTVFGFWIFLLTDFVLFGVLFACFAVLRESTFGGLGAKELFDIDFAIMQSCILLLCSFLSGLAGAAAHRRNKNHVIIFFTLTFLLGLLFMGYEFADFARLIQSGNSWKRSAFLSSFFTLLGTHGIHVVFGLLWIPVLLYPVVKEGIDQDGIRRISCLRLFWQFLNIVWVFIFAIVYFIGRG
jgi:cytochrome o ubiquinol oxidase subunit 3